MNIEIENVTKVISRKIILDHVNLSMENGKIYGLQGPNGSGKTMLMRLVAGLIRPTSGDVYINGRSLGKDMDFPDSLGLLLEKPAFLPNYTGLRNLMLLAQIKNVISIEDIREALLRVGLDPYDRRVFRKYSLGMKQRLGIAAAIMEKPDIILLDEPINALDEQSVERIGYIIQKERNRGALILMACHHGDFLESLSDEIFMVCDGKVMNKAE